MASRPASGVMFSAGWSRFARHRDRARTAPIQLVQDLLQRTELADPAHEMPGQQPHALLSRTRRRHRSFEATRSRRHPRTSFTETRPADPGGQGRMARERRAGSPRSQARGGQAGWRGKLRVRLRVILRCQPGRRGGKLGSWPATCSTTATSQTSAAWRSPRSKDTIRQMASPTHRSQTFLPLSTTATVSARPRGRLSPGLGALASCGPKLSGEGPLSLDIRAFRLYRPRSVASIDPSRRA
jgi:hypothetical protein